MIAHALDEVAILREGGRKLAKILRVLSEKVVPGTSTQTLEDEARRLIEEGADTAAFLGYKPDGAKRPYPAALCVSINDVVVHGIPNENPQTIQEGDIVTLDMGLAHKGLITDAAISVIAGKASPEDARLIKAVQEALGAGVQAAQVGNTIGDIGAAIEAVAETYELDFPRDLGGHGVGKRVHEEPHVPNFGEAKTGETLVDGLVLAIEPMMTRGGGKVKLDRDGYSFRTRDGSRAAHIEHTVLITKNGPEILTKE